VAALLGQWGVTIAYGVASSWSAFASLLLNRSRHAYLAQSGHRAAR